MLFHNISSMSIITGMLVFLAFALLTYITVWGVLRTSFGKVFTDLPGGRKVHQRVIPRIGGFCILIVFIPVISFWKFLPSDLFLPLPEALRSSLFWASIGILLVGFLDDSTFFIIENKAKLLFEFIVAVIIVFIQKVYFPHITIANFTISDPTIMKIITMIWIVGVTNAMNIIDGIDGLAGTVVLICIVAVGILGGLTGHMYLVSISMVLAGLVFGFLLHNYSPARVFFGDTGSLFFGIVMATFSVYLYSLEGLQSNFFSPIYLVGFPLTDIFVAMMRRYIKAVAAGNKWYKSFGATMVADNEHIHHRLIQRGLSHTSACVTLSFLAASFSIAAIFTALIPGKSFIIVVIYLSCMVFVVLAELDYFSRIERKFRAWRNRAKELSDPLALKVYIIHADDILEFSLKKYKQNMVDFTFVGSGNAIPDGSDFSTALINCRDIRDFDAILMEGTNLHHRFGVPIIIAIPEDITINDQDTKIMSRRIHYIVKPLYIPLLLHELTTVIKHGKDTAWNDGTLKGTTKIKAVREIP